MLWWMVDQLILSYIQKKKKKNAHKRFDWNDEKRCNWNTVNGKLEKSVPAVISILLQVIL